MIKDYYALAKPGLVYGNLIPMIAGFMLGTHSSINLGLLLATAVGIMLVMASGCVFNNYIDRAVDARMERTKDRALVLGRITGRAALVYGSVLGILGFGTLITFTNILAFEAAFIGFFFYVFMYSLWFKRRTVHGTVIGSIAGATPPLVGYAAAAGRLDEPAFLLFIMLVAWQIPHFYAIGIRRLKDYAAVHTPIMPVEKGIGATKWAMLAYITTFFLAALTLAVLGYTGSVYLALTILLCLSWLGLGIKGFYVADDAAWARNMFFLSLIVMTVLFSAIALRV